MPALDSLIAVYLKQDRSPQTKRVYKTLFARFAAAVGAKRDIRRITEDDLLDYIQSLRDRRIRDSTLHYYTNVLRTFFKWCVERGDLPRSPMHTVKLRRRKPTARRTGIPADDLQRLAEYLRHRPRDYAVFLFLVDTGCRIGVFDHLKWSDIDFGSLSAEVIEKGDKTVPLYFSAAAADALRHWRDVQRGAGVYVLTTTGAKGERCKSPAVSDIIHRASKAAGCSHLWRGHAIRHAVGEQWAMQQPPPIVQAKLNHSSPETTLRYYYPTGTSDKLRAAVAAISRRDSSGTARIFKFPDPA